MALDGLTLEGVSLNDETNFGLEAIDFTPPKKKPEFAQSSDGDGADLLRTPKYENRVVKMTLRVGKQASMDLALAKVGELVDLLQEAEKNPNGTPLVWTPATGSKKYTLYVLTGEIVEIPIVNEGSSAGYYAFSPQLKVEMTCKPFGYGTEVEGAAAKSIETGLSVVVLTVPTVTGDVPAEGRLVVKDTAAVGRRFVEWGLENRYYNAATALILDSEDMTPVGGAQFETLAGAYKRAGATKATIKTLLLPEPTVCCNTGNLKHVGTFRVKARVYASIQTTSVVSNVSVRMSWQDGEGPLRANTWQTPVTQNGFSELDLGVITISPAILGTQKWLGQIEAMSSASVASSNDVLHVDYLTFIPVLEGYGKARGVQPVAPGTISAFDNFTFGTLSGNLNTRTPSVGAAWATSGAATDWTVTSGAATRETKTDTEPRYAVLGSALGNSVVTAKLTAGVLTAGKGSLGVILRWVDSNNFAFALLEQSVLFGKTDVSLKIGVKIAGVTTVLNAWAAARLTLTSLGMTVTATATLDGALQAVAQVNASGEHNVTVSASHSAIATGGALASGKPGIYDFSETTGSAVQRQLVNITAKALPGIPYCVQPSRTMEVHSDSTIAQDSTGTYYGPPPLYRGSRFFVPQDGSANRTSRIIVKADRNDLEEADQEKIGDAFTVQPFYTPRFVAIPR